MPFSGRDEGIVIHSDSYKPCTRKNKSINALHKRSAGVAPAEGKTAASVTILGAVSGAG
jgi:hypothetical protein